MSRLVYENVDTQFSDYFQTFHESLNSVFTHHEILRPLHISETLGGQTISTRNNLSFSSHLSSPILRRLDELLSARCHSIFSVVLGIVNVFLKSFANSPVSDKVVIRR